MHNVFVYGTLKYNEPNHSTIDNAEGVATFVAKGKTKNHYPLVIATKYNIPFLLYEPGKGEIYEVDDRKLSHLDELEDHPNFYVRKMDDIEIESESGCTEAIKCWVYFLKKFKVKLLCLPMLESYSSLGDHGLPYLDRSRRDPNYDLHGEVLK